MVSVKYESDTNALKFLFFDLVSKTVRGTFCFFNSSIGAFKFHHNISVFAPFLLIYSPLLPTRCGFRTDGRSGGKESATVRSNKPKATSQPPTIYRCYRGATATRRQVFLSKEGKKKERKKVFPASCIKPSLR